MIYTVTCNPSLDYVVHMKRFTAGDINRAEAEMIYPGGKGVNVALVLGNLGIPAKMLGFIAGFTGREIERLAAENGGDCEFIMLDKGNSRINLKISAAEETAVNGMGPDVPPDKEDALIRQVEMMSDGDILVLAGSIPPSLPDTMYEKMMNRLAGRAVRIVVDAAGNLLNNVLQYKPFLIKPNQFELSELFGLELRTDEEITKCAQKLQDKGAQNVLVSLGGDGALLVGEDGRIYRMKSPEGTLVNSVGAGDSMIAGFLAGFISSGGDLREALKMGISAGSASAFCEWLAGKDDIDKIYSLLK